jgi:hypothetical protein
MIDVYLFNPEHDLALAHGEHNYTAPPFARQFRHDLRLLPAWLAPAGSYIAVPDDANRLEFTVTGAGTYRAACNGDATSLEPFTEPRMSLFHGQLVVVCQASKTPGVMTLTVKDPATGLKSTVNIAVQ